MGCRDASSGEQARAELSGSGNIRAFEIDVTSDSSVEAAAQRVQDQYGHLDVLVRDQLCGYYLGVKASSLWMKMSLCSSFSQWPCRCSQQLLQELEQVQRMLFHILLQWRLQAADSI